MSAARLAKDRPSEQDHDHDDGETGAESGDCERKTYRDSHPFARSTSSTSNAVPPGGVTLKESPQWPTITSAGAARE
jgi:hypothetical protein